MTSFFSIAEEDLPSGFGEYKYFGRKFSEIVTKAGELRKQLPCIVMRMIMNGVMNFDGTMDERYYENATKRDIWTYVFYLWRKNAHAIEAFKLMSDTRLSKRSKRTIYVPNPAKFVEVVKKYLKLHAMPRDSKTGTIVPDDMFPSKYLTIKELMKFIQIVFDLNKTREGTADLHVEPEIDITILHNLFNKLIALIDDKEKGLVDEINRIDLGIEKRRKLIEAKSITGYTVDDQGRRTPMFSDKVEVTRDSRGNIGTDITFKPTFA